MYHDNKRKSMKQEIEKRYVRPYMYNAIKCFNAMCNEIYKRGGHIVSEWQKELKFVEVYCRKDTLNLSDRSNIDKAKPVITPVFGCFASYIRFELGGHIYYLEVPSNVFESIRYSKIVCDDNLKVTSRAYCDEIKDSSKIMDVFYNQNPVITDNKTLIDTATELLDWLLNEANTNPYQSTEAVQVHNIYGNGYHTELVPVKYSCTFKRFDITTGKQIVG